MKRLFILVCSLCLLAWGSALLHAEDATEAKARRLFNALGCKGCHQFEGDGGSLAPPLDQIGSRKTRAEIKSLLETHAESGGKGFMPSYGTTSPEELELLSDFLYSHKSTK